MSGGQSRVALATIVVIGAALRLWDIGGQELWSDEALTAVIAHAPPWDLASKPIDPSGPLYYWLHQLFVPDGARPAAMRAISALCGILIIPMTFALGREMLDRKGALLAAALVGLSFSLIDYSKEARAYSFLTLLFCAAVWLAIRAAREEAPTKRRLLLAGFCIVAAAALYTHFVAFLFVAAVLLVLPGMIGRSALRRGEVYAAIAAVALLGAGEAHRTLLYATDTDGFGWLRPFSFPEFLAVLGREWLPGAPFGTWWGATALALIAACLFASRRQVGDAWKTRPTALAVIVTWAALPLLLWMFSVFFSPVLMPRTMLAAWPALALLVALGLERFRGRAWIAAVSGVVALYAGSLAFSGLSREKEDWAGAARLVKEFGADAVIVCAHWKSPPLLSALRQAPKPLLVFRDEEWRVVGRDRAGAWPSQYARSIWLREMKKYVPPQPPLERVTITLHSAALVESECSDPAARAAIAALGGTASPAWQSRAGENYDPALGDPAPISVRRLQFQAPMQLSVLRTRD